MITKATLESWRQAKNLAVMSFTTEPEVTIAIQEMYIEAKALRRDNLKLLNKQDLLDMLIRYVNASVEDHYMSVEMEELLEGIHDRCDELNIPVETQL